jgi:hypothetical protein
LHRGGIRSGTGRTPAEAQQMLDKIPPSQRAGVNQQTAAQNAKQYLVDKDASHIQSHNQGGSSNPDNILWENKSINRARGDKHMTPQEQTSIHVKAQFDNLAGALKSGLQAAPRGAAIGAVTAVPFALLKNGLRVVRGEISAAEAAKETAKETAVGAGVGAVTALTVTTVAAACPPVAIALTAISPALLAVGGAGMIHQFFQILGNHKQQVKDYYESLTESELQHLSQIEAEIDYEHQKTISALDEQQQITDSIVVLGRDLLHQLEAEIDYEHQKTISALDQQQHITDAIVNRPRESGVTAAIQRYRRSRQIYQTLQESSNQSQSLNPSQSKLLPPTNQ